MLVELWKERRIWETSVPKINRKREKKEERDRRLEVYSRYEKGGKKQR